MNHKDQRVQIGIRPEDFTIEDNGFEANVNDIQTIGRDVILHFSVGNVSARAIVSADEKFSEKARIGISRYHLFNPETGDLIDE